MGQKGINVIISLKSHKSGQHKSEVRKETAVKATFQKSFLIKICKKNISGNYAITKRFIQKFVFLAFSSTVVNLSNVLAIPA